MSDYFLYLMVDADTAADRFKVGISADPYRRSKQLGCDIDMERSRQIKVDNQRDAAVMEKAMHCALAEYNVRFPKYTQTEWFRLECFDFVKESFVSSGVALEKITRRTRPLKIEIPISLHDELRSQANAKGESLDRLIAEILEAADDKKAIEDFPRYDNLPRMKLTDEEVKHLRELADHINDGGMLDSARLLHGLAERASCG